MSFTGYLPREALLDLYARAALAVVPSRYEGFGYGVAQALCAGLPAVVADASSLPEVAAGAASLAPVDDVEAWSGAIGALLGNRDAAESRAQARRAEARERFSWSRAAETAAATYAAALDEGASLRA